MTFTVQSFDYMANIVFCCTFWSEGAYFFHDLFCARSCRVHVCSCGSWDRIFWVQAMASCMHMRIIRTSKTVIISACFQARILLPSSARYSRGQSRVEFQPDHLFCLRNKRSFLDRSNDYVRFFCPHIVFRLYTAPCVVRNSTSIRSQLFAIINQVYGLICYAAQATASHVGFLQNPAIAIVVLGWRKCG